MSPILAAGENTTEPFCGEDGNRNDMAAAAIFSIYSAVHVLCMLCIILRELRRDKSLLVLWVSVSLSIVMAYDAAAVAAFEMRGDKISTSAMVVRYVMQSIVVPLFLVCMFEIVYLVHKNRSVNFCGLAFDGGHRNRSTTNRCCSFLLRASVWFISIGLLVFLLAANIQFLVQRDEEDTEVDILEHIQTRFCDKSLLFSLEKSESLIGIADLIAHFSLLLASLYFGALLWRYGTHYAFAVYATYLNPWLVVFVGSLVLLGALFVPQGGLYVVDLSLVLLNMGVVWTISEGLVELKRGDLVKQYLRRRSLTASHELEGNDKNTLEEIAEEDGSSGVDPSDNGRSNSGASQQKKSKQTHKHSHHYRQQKEHRQRDALSKTTASDVQGKKGSYNGHISNDNGSILNGSGNGGAFAAAVDEVVVLIGSDTLERQQQQKNGDEVVVGGIQRVHTYPEMGLSVVCDAINSGSPTNTNNSEEAMTDLSNGSINGDSSGSGGNSPATQSAGSSTDNEEEEEEIEVNGPGAGIVSDTNLSLA